MRFVCGESKTRPCPCPGFLLLGLALQCSVLMTVGIRLENVTVPSMGLIGQSISLECQFRLEKDTLYSLKWYFNGQEFYRFSPSSRPSILTFPIDGVQVDTQELHNPSRIVLRNISTQTSGLYHVEISSEAPIFQTHLSKEYLFTVIIPPTPVNPRLSKFSPSIYMNEFLSGNCTSYRSYPAANLSFYINDRKWQDVTSYPPLKELDEKGREVWTVVSELKVRVTNDLFNKGIIRLQCKAVILDLEGVTSKNITHDNKSYSARNQYSSAARIRCCWSWTFFHLFSMSAFFTAVWNMC